MADTKQVSREVSYLSVTVPGYRGYASWDDALQSDTVFSEEVLSNLSEMVAIVSRMKRNDGSTLEADVVTDLDGILEKANEISELIGEVAPNQKAIQHLAQTGKTGQLAGLDYVILEKIGHISQTLSAMELEEGVGISPDEPESVRELLNDIDGLVRDRAGLIAWDES